MSKQQDKTCVPVVPQATEEQRETLHQKAIGKHIETKIEYQLMLRYQSDTELVVDVREDTVDLDGNPMGEEYVEGFFYDGSSLKKNYKDAVAEFLELRLKYPDAYEYDEVLEEATDLLAIRYGNGMFDIIAEVDADAKDEEKQYDLELQCAGDTGFSVRLKTQSEYIERFVYGGQGTSMKENYTKALKKFRKIKEEYAEKGIIVNQIKSDYDRD